MTQKERTALSQVVGILNAVSGMYPYNPCDINRVATTALCAKRVCPELADVIGSIACNQFDVTDEGIKECWELIKELKK